MLQFGFLLPAAGSCPLVELVGRGQAKPDWFTRTDTDSDASFLETCRLWTIDREANCFLITGSLEGRPENPARLARRCGQQLLLAALIERNYFRPLRPTAPRGPAGPFAGKNEFMGRSSAMDENSCAR